MYKNISERLAESIVSICKSSHLLSGSFALNQNLLGILSFILFPVIVYIQYCFVLVSGVQCSS